MQFVEHLLMKWCEGMKILWYEQQWQNKISNSTLVLVYINLYKVSI